MVPARSPTFPAKLRPTRAPAQVFEFAGCYLNIQAGAEVHYGKMCDALGQEELKEDPRFAVRKDRVTTPGPAGVDPRREDQAARCPATV
ncbi:hypothetical protein E8E95_00610 [Pseudomonas sp. BN414]|uniref:CoA transferase n=1 Tax=Pseudomonas sp. BN414 TaxID=2567888 RepID=UPI002454A58E|nr:CoA transferase [Pseudomonas sp. BN414]MDH4565186.1 hypothetical protein [Pseudomonas sp. BN414]